MIWLIGFVALGIVLAILELDPNVLLSISQNASNLNQSHHQWQLIAYVTLGLSALLGLLSYYGNHLVRYLNKKTFKSTAFHSTYPASTPKQTPPSTFVEHQTNPYYSSVNVTPLYSLKKTGVVKGVLRVSSICLFWLAVLSNTVSQRLDAIIAAPNTTIYVDAIVTPIGLSDTYLQTSVQKEQTLPYITNPDSEKGFGSTSKPKHNSKPVSPEVIQGYRQMVQLSDVSVFSSTQKYNDTNKELSSSLDNPFITVASDTLGYRTDSNRENENNEASNIKLESANHPSTLTGLPDVRVMLQSYRADQQWLNQLAPNESVRMRLALRPLKNTNNPDEFNEYRWLSSRHVSAVAKIIDVELNDTTMDVQSDSNHLNGYQLPNTSSNVYKTPIKTLQSDQNIWQTINLVRFNLRQHFLSTMKTIPTYGQSKRSDFDIQDQLNQSTLHHHGGAAVTLSLLTGDRSLISKEITGVYRFAGISHLLAISGTHVLFLALLIAGIVGFLFNKFAPQMYNHITRWQLQFIIAVVVAFIYSVFSGFDVPAVRTVCMVLLVGLLRYLLVVPAIFKVLLSLAVLMAWQDGFILWQAGFWLSFIAVAVLVSYSQRWQHQTSHNHGLSTHQDNHSRVVNSVPVATEAGFQSFWQALQNRIGFFVRTLSPFFKLQMWMTVALLPISLWLFDEVSLWGFVINLFAIGLFGWVIVPLNLLAGLIYMVSPPVADAIWSVLASILDSLHHLLFALESQVEHVGWLYTPMSLGLLVLFFLMVLPWVLPKGIVSRYLSLPVFAVACVAVLTNITDTSDQYASQTKTVPTILTVLDTKNPDYFAMLVNQNNLIDHNPIDHNPIINNETITQSKTSWLLLSEYKPDRHTKNHNATDGALQSELTAQLFKQLKQQGIESLTGIIVQTTGKGAVNTVAGLREKMTVFYYWQAGYDSASSLPTSVNFRNYVNDIIHPTGLSAQGCEVGRQWGGIDNKSDASLSIKAVTGWQEVSDKLVWDCSLQVHSDGDILLDQAGKRVKLGQKESNSERDNEAIIYTSAEPRLIQLWALMCRGSDVNSDNNVNQLSRQLSHWVTPSQAYLTPDFIDIIQPKDWQMVGSASVSNLHAKETHLYWQTAINQYSGN